MSAGEAAAVLASLQPPAAAGQTLGVPLSAEDTKHDEAQSGIPNDNFAGASRSSRGGGERSAEEGGVGGEEEKVRMAGESS